MSKHTPGPWMIGNENDQCCEVEAGLVRIALDRFNPWTGEEAISRAEMLANARLIAAAPEMLEKLQRIMTGDKLVMDEIPALLARIDGDKEAKS